jgi:hypothetical protein
VVETVDENLERATYRLRGLATALSWLLGMGIAMSGFSAIALIRRGQMIGDLRDDRYSHSYSEMDNADTLVFATYVWGLLLYFAVLVMLIVWAWRATKNLQGWGVELERGPGWAIGGWFVPIGNLFIPYQVVRETWMLAPSPDGSLPQERNGPWFAAWIMWLISGALGWQSFFSSSDDDLRTMQASDYLAGVSDIIWIAAAVALIVAVRQISDRHDRR